MKLHRLEIAGFGPFRERQHVDFDEYAADGIFLIAGRTGAGKSSILDAVCFGLYGSVPRFDKKKASLRSDHCADDDPSEVVVEFSTTAGRYRVTRTPEFERASKRGVGKMVTAKETAVLERREGDSWVGVAAKPRDVGEHMGGVLQLSRDQFLQVILLAQNRFAEFLLADSKDRLSLLRQLFGSHRFGSLQTIFTERRKESEAHLRETRTTILTRLSDADAIVAAHELGAEAGTESADGDAEESAVLSPSTAARIASLEAATERAQARLVAERTIRTHAQEQSQAAAAALVAARNIATAQAQRAAHRATLVTLEAEQAAVNDAHERSTKAIAAEALRTSIVGVTAARGALERAQRDEDTARRAWAQHDRAGVEVQRDALRSFVDAQQQQRGALQTLVAVEEQASRRAAAIAERERTRDKHTSALAALDAEGAELPARIDELAARADAARAAHEKQAALVVRRDEATAREAAAIEVESHRAALVAAEAERRAVHAELAARTDELDALHRRRFDGMAGELAQKLEDGEPCAVCGSTTHPAPAEHTDPVSAGDIDAATQRCEQSRERDGRARDALAEVASKLAAAQARAGERDRAQAESERIAADAELRACTERAADADILTAQVEAARARVAAIAEERLTLTAKRTAVEAELRAEITAGEKADAELAGGRGAFASIQERLTNLDTLVQAARDCAAALDATAAATASLRAREKELDDAVAQSIFDSADGAARALLSEADRASLTARVDKHAQQRHTVIAALDELAARELPDDAIDLEPLDEAAATARAVWERAVSAVASTEAVHEQLAATVAAVKRDHEASAAQTDAHEVLEALALAVNGTGPNTRRMSLETYVLAAELQEIVAAANQRLRDMSDGRYELRYSDALAGSGAASGLGILIYDGNTGRERSARSLSGGETFLSSLALALGLAEVVTSRAGGIQLETLFIDEGFGSLDADTLNVAMSTLDELRQGGRTVGVISHVEAMQETIHAQVRVESSDRGPSTIRS